MGNDANIERRLAAVMASDVAGYSRLMQADEAGTLKALEASLGTTNDSVSQSDLGSSLRFGSDEGGLGGTLRKLRPARADSGHPDGQSSFLDRRVHHNYCKLKTKQRIDKEGKKLPKRTPAMKMGLAKGPVRIEDILYFNS